VTDALAVAQARALGSPARRAIVAYLSGADAGACVGELTEHLGLNHNAVRKHLARLVAAELVVQEHERRTTAGRPRWLFRLAPGTAVAEERGYRRLAVLLAQTMATGEDPVAVGRRAASGATPAGGGIEGLAGRFAADGFEPVVRRRGSRTEVVLGRCPLADAAVANPDVVCRLHLGIAQGLAETAGGLEVDSLTPRDPRRAGCRVLVSEVGP
jgi:predicted ArsR family transcriptional regulator